MITGGLAIVHHAQYETRGDSIANRGQPTRQRSGSIHILNENTNELIRLHYHSNENTTGTPFFNRNKAMNLPYVDKNTSINISQNPTKILNHNSSLTSLPTNVRLVIETGLGSPLKKCDITTYNS
jgi:hypothetical protein